MPSRPPVCGDDSPLWGLTKDRHRTRFFAAVREKNHEIAIFRPVLGVGVVLEQSVAPPEVDVPVANQARSSGWSRLVSDKQVARDIDWKSTAIGKVLLIGVEHLRSGQFLFYGRSIYCAGWGFGGDLSKIGDTSDW